ncbi:hypothetical protein [Brevibacillus dissolubilis]|uniref:hypothetical protein n=1 Tax=Brevibacillus dissolubilis TaxID=1844116 RepID=UPI001115DAF7|nr:hypothetical protein [Brevibacillus dissolubilis]
MYPSSTQSMSAELQRLINQLQQHERNQSNTLRNLANQLQNLASMENQTMTLLQQIHQLSNQLAFEAMRHSSGSITTSGTTNQPQTATSSFQPEQHLTGNPAGGNLTGLAGQVNPIPQMNQVVGQPHSFHPVNTVGPISSLNPLNQSGQINPLNPFNQAGQSVQGQLPTLNTANPMSQHSSLSQSNQVNPLNPLSQTQANRLNQNQPSTPLAQPTYDPNVGAFQFEPPES